MNKAYCPRCKKFTESIIDEKTDEVLCKRCTRRHKRFNFTKLITGQ